MHVAVVVFLLVLCTENSIVSARIRKSTREVLAARKPGDKTHILDISHYRRSDINTKPGDYPWVASVQATNFQRGWHLCGGTLITHEWVLTAGHCLDHEKAEWLWVVLGEYNIDFDENREQNCTVDYFILHPKYDYSKKPNPNDVALVHLSTHAKFNEFVRPIKLPSTYQQFTGPCVEMGWGAKNTSGGHTSTLSAGEVPLLDNSECRIYTTNNDILNEQMFCAGDLEGGRGFCNGDNGGPVLCTDKRTDKLAFAGIMSYRIGCALKNFPALYMSVPHYDSWINSIINK